MVYLTGDTHGELDRFKHGRLRWLGKRDIVVVLGDFGFVWDGSKEEQKKLDWLRKRPYTLLFLDGAHENYDLLAQYPVEERFGGRVQALGGNVYHVCRGSVLELEGKKYLFAHAMTSHPDVREEDRYYMRGTMDIDSFFFETIHAVRYRFYALFSRFYGFFCGFLDIVAYLVQNGFNSRQNALCGKGNNISMRKNYRLK